jgi:hypothetical protein
MKHKFAALALSVVMILVAANPGFASEMVTVDNFVRAETDMTLGRYVKDWRRNNCRVPRLVYCKPCRVGTQTRLAVDKPWHPESRRLFPRESQAGCLCEVPPHSPAHADRKAGRNSHESRYA